MQAVAEIQRSLGKVEASVEALKTSIDSTKSDVKALVAWKNAILGGAAVIGAVIAMVAYLAGKASDDVTIKSPAAIQMPSVPSPAQPTMPAPGSK
jgi:hypothetical protein